jgi:hypothetical protein
MSWVVICSFHDLDCAAKRPLERPHEAKSIIGKIDGQMSLLDAFVGRRSLCFTGNR